MLPPMGYLPAGRMVNLSRRAKGCGWMRNFAELGKRVGAILASSTVPRMFLVVGSSVLAVPGALAQSPHRPAWDSTSLPGHSSAGVKLAELDAVGPPKIAGATAARSAAAVPPRTQAGKKHAHGAAGASHRSAHHHVGVRQTAAGHGHARRAAGTPAGHRPATGETRHPPAEAAPPKANPTATTGTPAPPPMPPVGAAPAEAAAQPPIQSSAAGSAPVAHPATVPTQVAATAPGHVAKPPPVAVPAAAPAAIAAGTTIRFAPGTTEVAADAQPALNAFAQRLKADPDLRAQVIAYASGNDDEANQARRISLARAIAVRAYLIDQGVLGTRMVVRALGNRSADSGPADRVDLLVLDR